MERWREHVLTESELTTVVNVVDEIFRGQSSLPVDELLASAGVMAAELPRSVRSAFAEFRCEESYVGLSIVDPTWRADDAPPTPHGYRVAGQREEATREDAVQCLLASLLGSPFTWSSIQDGYLFNDVFPIRDNAQEPISSGSDLEFGLHTEDAFSELAGDYLSWRCVRNPHGTETLIAAIDDVDLDEATQDVLRQERFLVGANIAHRLEQGRSDPCSVLFGARSSPYIRLNLNRMSAVIDDPEAASALSILSNRLRSVGFGRSFAGGEFAHIDNYRCAHGRLPYQPRYDGTDRWLRRLYVSSMFRASRALRCAPTSWILDVVGL